MVMPVTNDALLDESLWCLRDHLHPQWGDRHPLGSASMGMLCFVLGTAVFLWQVDRPDLRLYLPCGIGCALLLSGAFGRPVGVVALALFILER